MTDGQMSIPRTDGPCMAGNLSALKDLDHLSLPVIIIVISALGTIEYFPYVVMACSEHLYKFDFIILPLEIRKWELKRLNNFPQVTYSSSIRTRFQIQVFMFPSLCNHYNNLTRRHVR